MAPRLVSVVYEMLERAGVAGRRWASSGSPARSTACSPVDAELRPLRDALIWLDRRGVRQAAALAAAVGGARAVRAHRPQLQRLAHGAEDDVAARRGAGDVRAGAAGCRPVGGYLVGWLTGEVVQDHANASSTLLYDVAAAAWSEQLVAGGRAGDGHASRRSATRPTSPGR